MSALDAFLIILAVLALLGVIFEEVIHINKAKVTLFFGTMSWMLLFLFISLSRSPQHKQEPCPKPKITQRQ